MAATKPATRRNTAIAAACLYFLSIIMLILVLIGNTSNKHILNEIYFFRLDVSDIIPISVQNAVLLNSVARSLGLHDFYQVGAWNFCEGYKNEGVTFCSKPTPLYWFNPVQILMDELLAGAQIALPSAVNTVLGLLKLGQQVMFGFFMTGIILNLLILLATPLVLRARGWSFPMSLAAAASGACITVAAGLASALTLGAKYALTAQEELNIRVDVGVRMFVFMWLAAAFTDVAFLLHSAMACFCRTGRKEAAVAPETDSSASSPTEKKRFGLPRIARKRKVPSSVL